MIRRLVESDWAALRALRLEALETEPQSFAADLAEYQSNPPEYLDEELMVLTLR